jgi:hypothetical protein
LNIVIKKLNLYVSSIDKHSNCILILIYKDNNTAVLQGISSDKCFRNPEFNNGKNLRVITIKFLKKYQEKFNINQIELTNNSYIACNYKDVKIWLVDLSLLQHNESFYEKFGFGPSKNRCYVKLSTPQLVLHLLLHPYPHVLPQRIYCYNHHHVFKSCR